MMCSMQFEQCLQREVATAEKDKNGFIKEFSEADYEAVVGGWKVRMCNTITGTCKHLSVAS